MILYILVIRFFACAEHVPNDVLRDSVGGMIEEFDELTGGQFAVVAFNGNDPILGFMAGNKAFDKRDLN